MTTHLRLPVVFAFALYVAACGEDSTSPASKPIVDQEFAPGNPNAFFGVGVVGAWAQTFTVGVTGMLHSIDLILVGGVGDDVIRIDIRGTTSGNPNLDDGTVLGSVLVAAPTLPMGPSIPPFVPIDFTSQQIPVIAGQTLAIVLIRVVGSGTSDVFWVGENGAEEYPGGTALQRNGGSGAGWTALPGNDLYFRTKVLAP